jgi:hypothetical protein
LTEPLRRSWASGGSFYTNGVISYGPPAKQRWSGAEVARQVASESYFAAHPSSAESRIAELERLLGRKQLELDFFKEPSNKSGEQRRIVPAMAARDLSQHRSLTLVRRRRTDRGAAMPVARSESKIL